MLPTCSTRATLTILSVRETSMSDAAAEGRDPIDLRETLSRIDRNLAETDKALADAALARQHARTDGWKTGAAIAIATVAVLKLIELAF